MEWYNEIDLKKQVNKQRLRGDTCKFWNEDFNKWITQELTSKKIKRECPNLEQNVAKVDSLHNYILRYVKI